MLPPLIRSTEYDAAKKALTVRFQVGVYRFHGVPEDLGNAMQNEPARDTLLMMFNSQVEGKYRSERIGT